MHVVAVVAAGGQGIRLGAVVPKQFLEIGGRTLLDRSVTALLSAPVISEVIVAVFMLEALRSCAPERENVVRSSRRLSNHEPREMDNNFIYCTACI